MLGHGRCFTPHSSTPDAKIMVYPSVERAQDAKTRVDRSEIAPSAASFRRSEPGRPAPSALPDPGRTARVQARWEAALDAPRLELEEVEQRPAHLVGQDLAPGGHARATGLPH